MKEEKLIDQSQLAEDVSSKISYEFNDVFLVKPLPDVMVKKEFSKLPENKKPVADENGVEAVELEDNEVETEIKEVPSNFCKGVVLKVPYGYTQQMKDEKYPAMSIKIGDILIYKRMDAQYFDLLKDTQIIRMYGVLGIER